MVDTPDMEATASATAATADTARDIQASRSMNNKDNTSLAMDHALYGPPQPMDMVMDTDHTEQRVINYSIIQIRV